MLPKPPKYVKLKDGKKERAKQLLEIYLSLAHLKTDTARFREMLVIIKGAVSLRTLNNYEKEYKWHEHLEKAIERGRPIDTNGRNQNKRQKDKNLVKSFIGNTMPAILTMPGFAPEHVAGTPYTKDEKERIIKAICEYYSTGAYSIVNLCQAQGVAYGRFIEWLTAPDMEYFYQLYLNAKSKHQSNYVVLLEESMKVQLLYFVSQEDMTETHFVYDMVKEIDDAGEVIFVEHPKEKRVVIRKNRLDAASMQYAMGILRQMVAGNNSEIGNADVYNKMSIEELKVAIAEEEEKIKQIKSGNTNGSREKVSRTDGADS